MDDLRILAKSHCNPIMVLRDEESPILGRDIELEEFVNKQSEDRFLRELHHKISLESLKKVVGKRYEEYWEHKLQSDKGLQEIFTILKKLDLVKEEKDKEKDTDYIFITINPYDHIDIYQFIKVVQKLITKKWIKEYLYTIEQRGEVIETAGFRPHCHMILYRKGKNYSEIVREFRSSLKKICNTENSHILNFEVVKVGTIDRVINYALGNKKDEYKHVKVEMDKIFREKIGIKEFYNNGLLEKVNYEKTLSEKVIEKII